MLVGGRKYRLNVSGGSGGGNWTDLVSRVAHIGCGSSTAVLRSLAAVALAADDCRDQGTTLEIQPLEDYQQTSFVEAAAAITMRSRLGPGSQVVLGDGWDYQGSRGPLTVESRPHRKRYFVCTNGSSRVRVQYAAIDWIRTAEANGVAVARPVLINRIALVLSPAPAADAQCAPAATCISR